MRQVSPVVAFAFLFLILGSVPSNKAWTKQVDDVAQWLDRDTAVLVQVEDVHTAYDRISELELFSNPKFLSVIEMISDERFPILKIEDMNEAIHKFTALESLILNIDKLSIVIHSFDEQQFEWSVFLKAKPDVLLEIKAGLEDADEFLDARSKLITGSQPTGYFEYGIVGEEDLSLQNEPKDFSKLTGDLSEDVDPEKDAELKKQAVQNEIELRKNGQLGWATIKRVQDWMIISNADRFLEDLDKRVGNPKFRSLAKSRKYKGILATKSPIAKDAGLISVYGTPVKMGRFFPRFEKYKWDLWKMHEMPACGINIVINPPNKDKKVPRILADAIVKFTKPAVGRAKSLHYYRDIEIPSLAAKPTELKAFARDEAAVTQEAIARYDAAYGEGAAAGYWESHFAGTGINYQDSFARRRSFLSYRFVDDDHSKYLPGYIVMEQIENHDAAERYFRGLVDTANSQNGGEGDKADLIGEPDGDGVLWWKRNGDQLADNFSAAGQTRSNGNRADLLNLNNDAYALSQEWFVQGDSPIIEKQVELLTTGTGEDYGQPIREMMEDILTRFRADTTPFQVTYLSQSSWQETIDEIEDQYAMANGTLKQLDHQLSGSPFKPVGGKGSTAFDIDVKMLNKEGIDPQNLIISLENLEMQMPSEGQGSDDGEARKIQSLNLNSSNFVLSYMAPKPLGERNSDGYRLKIENQQDLEKAIELMFYHALNESLPEQMILYTKNDERFRILMGIYAGEEDEGSEPKD